MCRALHAEDASLEESEGSISAVGPGKSCRRMNYCIAMQCPDKPNMFELQVYAIATFARAPRAMDPPTSFRVKEVVLKIIDHILTAISLVFGV